MQKENYKFSDEEWAMFQQGVEIWRDIEGYEGVYQVSTLGKVKSVDRLVNMPNGFKSHIKDKIMKYGISKFGYCLIILQRDKICTNKTVHRLVMYAFLENPENKAEVNHKDGVKTNNHLSNLEVVTRSENILHSFAIGTRKPTCEGMFGSLHWNSKPIQQIDRFTGEVIATYDGLMDASRNTGMKNFKNISAVARGLRNQAGGYVWKYV
jgi:hypothetical protein